MRKILRADAAVSPAGEQSRQELLQGAAESHFANKHDGDQQQCDCERSNDNRRVMQGDLLSGEGNREKRQKCR
jgi:hypothetical protein